MFRAILFLVAAALYGQPSVGYVLDLEGSWAVSRNTSPLAPGQHLPAGALLTNTSPGNDDRIVVADLNGNVIKTIRCRNHVCRECSSSSGPCLDPIRPLPRAQSDTNPFSVTFDAVMGLLAEKPERYSAHRVRGDAVTDAVLQLQDHQLDVRPAFRALSKGRYYVSLQPLKAAEPAQAQQTAFDWDPGNASGLVATGIAPGLWELGLVDRDAAGAFSVPHDEAWVLIASPENFAAASAAFEQAGALQQKWAAAVSPDTGRAFLRATLDRLAQRYAGKN